MNVLDWFLVVLVLAYAVSGYWQGFIAGAFATGGLLLGGLLGVWLAPRLLGDAEPGALGVARPRCSSCSSARRSGRRVLQYAGARIRVADQVAAGPGPRRGRRCGAEHGRRAGGRLGARRRGQRGQAAVGQPRGAQLGGARTGQRRDAGRRRRRR